MLNYIYTESDVTVAQLERELTLDSDDNLNIMLCFYDAPDLDFNRLFIWVTDLIKPPLL